MSCICRYLRLFGTRCRQTFFRRGSAAFAAGSPCPAFYRRPASSALPPPRPEAILASRRAPASAAFCRTRSIRRPLSIYRTVRLSNIRDDRMLLIPAGSRPSSGRSRTSSNSRPSIFRSLSEHRPIEPSADHPQWPGVHLPRPSPLVGWDPLGSAAVHPAKSAEPIFDPPVRPFRRASGGGKRRCGYWAFGMEKGLAYLPPSTTSHGPQ
jgi:hypothetical protein